MHKCRHILLPLLTFLQLVAVVSVAALFVYAVSRSAQPAAAAPQEHAEVSAIAAYRADAGDLREAAPIRAAGDRH